MIGAFVRLWPSTNGLTPVGDPPFQRELGAGEPLGFGSPKLELVLRGVEPPDAVPSPCPRSVFRGWEVAESHVRTTLVMITSPGFDQHAGLGDGVEPMQVKAFIPNVPLKVSMKALSVGLPRREKSMRTP